jgi:DNA-binding response OmpR family regulator
MNAILAGGPKDEGRAVARDVLARWRSAAKPSIGARMLVVSCERSLVRYLQTFLTICGYRNVDTALSAAEAFRKAEVHPPDVLIIMMLMPEISGVDIGLRISQQSNCGVLFLTAANVEEPYFKDFVDSVKTQGCACMVLPLPFENMDLLTKLKLLAWRH